MDWKTIGVGALANIIISISLSEVFLPLVIVGPIIGGFLASYLTKGFEDSGVMEPSDGAVVGTMSGIIGGLIIGFLFIAGLGDVITLTGVIGGSYLLTWYVIIQVSVVVSLFLGLIGGIIGVVVKN